MPWIHLLSANALDSEELTVPSWVYLSLGLTWMDHTHCKVIVFSGVIIMHVYTNLLTPLQLMN